jgi:hypothetical protein
MLESENIERFQCSCIHQPQLMFLKIQLLKVSTFFLAETSYSKYNVTTQYHTQAMK